VLGARCELLAAAIQSSSPADIRLEGETLRITAQRRWQPSDQAAQQSGGGMRVWLQKTEAVAHIRTLLDREGKGKARGAHPPHRRRAGRRDHPARRLQPLAAAWPRR